MIAFIVFMGGCMKEEEQMYEITSAVPIPAPRVRNNYPYEQLQVGESFWVPIVAMQPLCNANRRNGKRLGRRFVCRRDDGGVRVWRVE
jgi:hypothetical protein